MQCRIFTSFETVIILGTRIEAEVGVETETEIETLKTDTNLLDDPEDRRVFTMSKLFVVQIMFCLEDTLTCPNRVFTSLHKVLTCLDKVLTYLNKVLTSCDKS